MNIYPIIKTKKITYNVQSVIIDYSVFDIIWRTVRARFKYKGFTCFVCNKEFIDREKISMLLTDKGNKVACNCCAAKIKIQIENDEI